MTSAAPTSVEPGREIVDVVFDGDQCAADGPNVVPSGPQPFVLDDLTGEGLADVRTMAIAADHNYQDLLDIPSEAGEYFGLPAWAEWPLTTFESVDRELAENQTGKVLILEPGEHGIVVGTGKGIWICGAINVTDTTSSNGELTADATIGVTFDGTLCSLDDAAEAVSGDQIFVFTNESELPVRMKVMVLTDRKTYQDLLAIQTDNGGPGSSWSGPAWMPEALISFTPVDLALAANQSALRYDLEPGPHAVLAFATTSPFAIWLCGPLDVAEG